MTAELKQNAATGAPASSWKPYPAYKDSDVEWLGKVPENNAKSIFQTGLTGSTGYVLSSERKATLHKSLSIYTIIRPGTRMTRIGRISTDNHIRVHPCHPCNPCSIVEDLDRKISYLWPLSSIRKQEAAR